MKNLTVRFVLTSVAKGLGSLGQTAKSLGAIGKSARATTKPLGAVNKATKETGTSADKAAKSLDKVDKGTREVSKSMSEGSRSIGKYGADLGRLEKRAAAVGRVWGRNLRRGLGDVFSEKNVERATTAFVGYVTSVYAGVTAGALWIRSQSKQAEELYKSSVAAGITADSYQRLKYAFSTNNLGVEQLDSALGRLNKQATLAAAGGKEQARAFKALGISTHDGNKKLKSADALMGEIADKFANMRDGGGKKSTLADMLFGETGRDLIPLLNKGSKAVRDLGDEAKRLGYILDDKTIRASSDLNTKWDKLFKTVGGLKNQIWIGLIPSVTSLVGYFQNLLDLNREDILRGITKGVAWLDTNMPSILKGLADLWKFLSIIGGAALGAYEGLGKLGGVLDAFAVLLIGKLAGSLLGATMAVWGFNGALWAFPGTWIIGAIAAVAAVAYLLIRHWDKVSAWFVKQWNWFKDAFTSLPIWAQVIISLPLTIITHWKELSTWFVDMWSGIKSAFVNGAQSVWDALPDWFQKVLKGAAFVLSFTMPGGSLIGGQATRSIFGREQAMAPSAAPQSIRSQQQAGLLPVAGQSGKSEVEITFKNPPAEMKVSKFKSTGVDTSVDIGSLKPGF